MSLTNPTASGKGNDDSDDGKGMSSKGEASIKMIKEQIDYRGFESFDYQLCSRYVVMSGPAICDIGR
jgi:hypothetical protein